MVGYVCFASFVLLNGLIGVFRTAFDEVADDRVRGDAPASVERGLAAAGPLGRARWSLRTHPLFPLFAVAYAALAVAEPFAIALHNTVDRRSWLLLQFCILALSTTLSLAMLIATARGVAADVEWKDKGRGPWDLARLVVDGVAAFELLCLGLGMGLLLFSPGLAALRCLRLFRVLWLIGLDEARLDGGETRMMTPAKLGHLTLRCVAGEFPGHYRTERLAGRPHNLPAFQDTPHLLTLCLA